MYVYTMYVLWVCTYVLWQCVHACWEHDLHSNIPDVHCYHVGCWVKDMFVYSKTSQWLWSSVFRTTGPDSITWWCLLPDTCKVQGSFFGTVVSEISPCVSRPVSAFERQAHLFWSRLFVALSTCLFRFVCVFVCVCVCVCLDVSAWSSWWLAFFHVQNSLKDVHFPRTASAWMWWLCWNPLLNFAGCAVVEITSLSLVAGVAHPGASTYKYCTCTLWGALQDIYSLNPFPFGNDFNNFPRLKYMNSVRWCPSLVVSLPSVE